MPLFRKPLFYILLAHVLAAVFIASYKLADYYENPQLVQETAPPPTPTAEEEIPPQETVPLLVLPPAPTSSTSSAEIATSTPKRLPQPAEVKAVYLTAGTAASSARMREIMALIDTTELNAVVIDVKDGSGTYLSSRLEKLVEELHDHNIYTIARMTVFSDSAFALARKDLAITQDDGLLWMSGKSYWIDPASSEAWQYVAETAEKTLALGFDEVNFDYIRFPSDGDLAAARYPFYDGTTPKEAVLDQFFSYLVAAVKAKYPDAVLSADVFAHSFLGDFDVGIGQRLTMLARHFDVVAPMIYPSHYAPWSFGFENPAAEPYAVMRKTLESGTKLLGTATSTATIRPWIQDFNLGAFYDATLVRDEIRAIGDAGYTAGWMVWNPSNRYEPEKFELDR